ncbi:5'-nucleotidase, lipoprotein e(P4) family [Pedobacter sp. HMF7056]|uniref:5'-nucleotidase, lipoprotein e(P4) family n=2 Tax=Hufsiella ginkgonis TaxID=2695274 RepID=A0A7K1Y3B0_9SPHI|nr:5'-nucleotidase, lipoprotein e(P4) family [Hufsiella ginkgonis]
MKAAKLIAAVLLLSPYTLQAQEKPAYTRDNVNAVLWQQHSGEYRALAYQAYTLARYRLDEILKVRSAKPRCVIVDIDETVLDNAPFQGHELQKGVSYDQNDWLEWTAKASADTVPGALSFLKYAAKKNVQVFYVTNRLKTEFDATLKNLKALNFPFADEKHLLVKDATSDKEPRRKLIAEKYNIVLLCGDNLNDFSDLFYLKSDTDRSSAVDQARAWFGKRFIVLPNPMYGDWEAPLYDYKKGLTEDEKAGKRIEALKGY